MKPHIKRSVVWGRMWSCRARTAGGFYGPFGFGRTPRAAYLGWRHAFGEWE